MAQLFDDAPTQLHHAQQQQQQQQQLQCQHQLHYLDRSDVGILIDDDESNSMSGSSQQQQQKTPPPLPQPGGFVPLCSQQSDGGPKQLIVNYLSSRLSDEELRQIFEEFGEVDCARINYNFKTGASRGYGFVYFVHSKDAAEAIRCLNGFELYGKFLRVTYAVPQRLLKAARQIDPHYMKTSTNDDFPPRPLFAPQRQPKPQPSCFIAPPYARYPQFSVVAPASSFQMCPPQF